MHQVYLTVLARAYTWCTTTRLMACTRALLQLMATRPSKHGVVEVGSGIGELTIPAARWAPNVPVHALDRDPEARVRLSAIAKAKGLANLTVSAFDANAAEDFLGRDDIPELVDLVLCTATLQYVADDVGLLRWMAAIAAPQAQLLLYVPVGYRRVLPGFDRWVARNFARQDYDRREGLRRRYTRAQVLAVLAAAGWRTTAEHGVTGRLGQLHYELHTLLLYATRAWRWPLPLLALYLPLGVVLTRLDDAIMRAHPQAEGNGLLVIAERAA